MEKISETLEEQLETTKAENKKKICLFDFESINGEIVTYDKEKKINGSFCKYCLAHTELDPFRNCGENVKISTICRKCMGVLDKIHWLQETRTKDKNIKDLVDAKNLVGTMNFEEIEKNIKNSRETFSRLTKKYKSSPDEIKCSLKEKFGDSIVFGKGRNNMKFVVDQKEANDTATKEVISLEEGVESDSENKDEPIMETKVKKERKRKNSVSGITITDIETQMAAGMLTVKKLSEKFGVSPPVIKGLLETHYGDRVKFSRGRNGGIKIS